MGITSSHKPHAQRIWSGTVPGTALQTDFLLVPEGCRLVAFVVTPRRDRIELGEYAGKNERAAEAAMLADAGLIRRWKKAERDWANSRSQHRRTQRGKWFKHRRRIDAAFRLGTNMRAAIYQSLKGLKNRRHWQTLAGYTLADLRAHLEPLLTDGMTWANYGEWHVDHVRPLASFNITDAECNDFKAAWALSNLQPLWAQDNLRKGARLPAVVHARRCNGSGVLREATDTPQAPSSEGT